MFLLICIAVICVSNVSGITTSDGWNDDMAGGRWQSYPLEDVPLEVKTTSAIGSGHAINFDVANGNEDKIGRIVVRLDASPIYFVEHCQDDTPLEDLPEADDNVRAWKFFKHGDEGISIMCNEVLVASFSFADSLKGDECRLSKWFGNRVELVKFSNDFNKAVARRAICQDDPPKLPDGVVADKMPPILFGDKISFSCSEENMIIDANTADGYICDHDEESNYETWTLSGESEPMCVPAPCNPPEITDGTVFPNSRVGHGVEYTVTCNDGFTISGPEKITCSYGKLSEIPECKKSEEEKDSERRDYSGAFLPKISALLLPALLALWAL